MDVTRYIIFVFVFLIVNTPIYYQLYRVFLRNKKPALIIVFSILYWSVAVFTENLLPFIAVIFLLFYYHLPTDEGESYIRDINIWKFNKLNIFNITVLTLIAKTVLTMVNVVYIQLITFFINREVQPQEVVTSFYESGFWLRFILFFIIVIFAPFVEEYVFRYFLYDKVFLPRMPKVFAASLSAIIFTIAHYNLSGIPSFFGLALFCTRMYEKKGYFAAVTAHMAFNLSTVVLLMFAEL